MTTDIETLRSIADTVASLHAVGAEHRREHCVAAADRIRAAAAAITAHVEAEVARRLAAAPDVEQQIDLLRRTAYGATITGVSVGGMRETIDRLRAAIAADKARAVANARRIGFKAGSAERSSVHDAIGVSPQDAARAAMAHGVPCPTCGSEARPTPDEARRLVEAAIGAGWTAACPGNWSDEQRAQDQERIAAARAALLRALGVEA